MTSESFASLIASAHAGQTAAIETILRHFEPWLKILARSQTDTHFGAKFDPADIVQQTLIAAVRDFPRFRGSSEPELAAWLRGILGHVLAHEMRRYQGTQKRDLAREVSFEQELTDASLRLGDLVPGPATSPDHAALCHERELRLAQVLERLPEDYRTVLVLRHLEDLPHDEIAKRMNRNPGAIRMLWVRALSRLRQELDNHPSLRP
jgi:RNA polymerase sigma-70 factor (ECF subfamily)